MTAIRTEQLEFFLQPEVAFLVLLLVISTWLFYWFLLKDVSEERHKSLTNKFRVLWQNCFLNAALYSLYWILKAVPAYEDSRYVMFLGAAVLIIGLVIVVSASRIFVLQYLFLGSMKAGVPILLVNIFSLCLSIALGLWFASSILGVSLAPLLATSAVFSIILGMALQDTLGNLFAGIAVQFDKPYKIGDWIEIINGTQKVVGQVHEITWRATLLIGFGDEMITLPNRVVAQAQVANFSLGPFYRTQIFRIPFGCDLEKARQTLMKVADEHPKILKNPKTNVLVNETTDSWITIKIIYAIESYGQQMLIADQLLTNGLIELNKAGIEPAPNRLQITNEKTYTA